MYLKIFRIAHNQKLRLLRHAEPNTERNLHMVQICISNRRHVLLLPRIKLDDKWKRLPQTHKISVSEARKPAEK